MPVLVHVLDKVLVVNFANIVFGPDEGAVKVQWHVGKGRHTYVGIQFLNCPISKHPLTPTSQSLNFPTIKFPFLMLNYAAGVG